MSSVSTAVAKQKDEGALAVMAQHRAELTLVLPSHINAESWYASTRAALTRNPDLMAAAQASPQTLIDALHEAARLGLQPGTEEYYLTPRKDKGRAQILGITGYQGEIELIYRAGAVSSVKCELVYTGDTFDWRPGDMDRPHHETADWFADRGTVRGAYAYAIMKDTGATSRVVIVDQTRIKRAMDASASANSSHSPWKTDYGKMVLKTAAHDLTAWVPTSAEYRREELRAVRDVAAETPSSQRQAGSGTTPTPAAPAGRAAPDDAIEGEIVDTAPPAGPILPTGSQRMGSDHQTQLFAKMREAGVEDFKGWAGQVLKLDGPVSSWGKVSADQANTLMGAAQARIDGTDTGSDTPAADDHADELGDLAAEGEQGTLGDESGAEQ